MMYFKQFQIFTNSESSKAKTVYVSSCSDASSEMGRLSTMMSSITALNYIVPKKRRSFANMTKEDWNLTSDQLTSSDEYLLLLSNGYFNDDICLLGMTSLSKYTATIPKWSISFKKNI